ncbi:MAG: hypothetical protein ACE5E9_13480, partial [Nitrospinaceae bacterium]
ALEVLSETGDAEAQRMVRVILGVSFWRCGDWNRALALFEEAVPIGPSSVPEPYRPLHEALEKAVPQLEQRVWAAQTNNNPLRLMQAHFALIPLCLCMGKKEEAAIHLNQAESLARQLQQENISRIFPKLQSLMD